MKRHMLVLALVMAGCASAGTRRTKTRAGKSRQEWRPVDSASGGFVDDRKKGCELPRWQDMYPVYWLVPVADARGYSYPEVARIVASAGRSVVLRSRPDLRATKVAVLRSGQFVVVVNSKSWRDECSSSGGLKWKAVATFSGAVGWIRSTEMRDASASTLGEKESSTWCRPVVEGDTSVGGLRVGTWCAHMRDGREYGARMEQIMDGYDLQIALVKCLTCAQARTTAPKMRSAGFGARVGECGPDGQTVMTVWRTGSVELQTIGKLSGVAGGQVVALCHEVSWKGRRVKLINLQWRKRGRRVVSTQKAVVRYLRSTKELFRDGALVAGEWPTEGQSQTVTSLGLVWKLARSLEAFQIHTLPTILPCSGYEGSSPHLTDYFVWWGTDSGLDGSSHAEARGMCEKNGCSSLVQGWMAELRWASDISGTECPIVLELWPSSTRHVDRYLECSAKRGRGKRRSRRNGH